MKKSRHDEQRRRIVALEERVSRLTAAVLRVSASLDLETVLHEVVDGARELTGARYGAITTIDDKGQPQDFITTGFPEEVHRRLLDWGDAPRLFPHFRDLPGPLRVPDVRAYIESLGFSSDRIPVKSFQGTPMRHRGVLVGSFFLAEKDNGREFDIEDEETLVLFAAQAATAIANARTYRDERRARADIEALVETSPVGVVVLDAATGDALSINREAKRILGSLLGPDRPLEDLREVLTSRLANGREVTLDELKSAETMRAEEIELSVPDGSSVRMLINVTPIRFGDGEIESVVVTMQDLAPIEEMERLRVEFLGMVSHELRAPLTSIKGSTTTLLNAPRSLDRAETRQFIRIIDQQADHMQGLIGDLLDAGRIETGTLSVDPEPLEVSALVEQARATFLSGEGRQTIGIDLAPDLPWVMADERRIVQVLNNLFSNAARHSPDSSPIEISAVRDGIEVAISVTDQGRGVAPEQLPHLFRRYADAGVKRGAAGFGLGLVICKGLVEAHGGRIRAESAGPGLGTRVTFTLPVAEETVAGTTSVVFVSGGRTPGEEREPLPVLVVDDDPETLRHVRDALAGAGYVPHVTGEPEEVAQLVRTKRPRLVLLDLMLPRTDGIELMRSVPEMADLPVIFISVYGRDETIVRALEAGAADYIVKPFSAAELIARVRAALRRRDGAEPFVLGELAIDYERRHVTLAGNSVELTPTEYELLRVLSLNAGRVVTYSSLLRQAWSDRDRISADGKLVRAVVKRLRDKLGDDADRPVYILNERGVGYRMPGPDE